MCDQRFAAFKRYLIYIASNYSIGLMQSILSGISECELTLEEELMLVESIQLAKNEFNCPTHRQAVKRHCFLFLERIKIEHRFVNEVSDIWIDGNSHLMSLISPLDDDVKMRGHEWPGNMILDVDENDLLIIRPKIPGENEIKYFLFWWFGKRGYMVGNSLGFYSDSPQEAAANRINNALKAISRDPKSLMCLLNGTPIDYNYAFSSDSCSYIRQLLAGFVCHSKDAIDLGICTTAAAQFKGKWFLRSVLKSFCAHRRPVNVQKNAAKAIFEHLEHIFDKMETPFNLKPLDSHYHKIAHIFSLFDTSDSEMEKYNFDDLYQYYASNTHHSVPATQLGFILKSAFPHYSSEKLHVCAPNMKQEFYITQGIKPLKTELVPWMDRDSVYQLWIRSECEFGEKHVTQLDHLWEHYNIFCANRNVDPLHRIHGTNQFSKKLQEIEHVECDKGKGDKAKNVRFINGIRLIKYDVRHVPVLCLLQEWISNYYVQSDENPIRSTVMSKDFNTHLASIGRDPVTLGCFVQKMLLSKIPSTKIRASIDKRDKVNGWNLIKKNM